MENQSLHERIRRIETLLHEVEKFKDPDARRKTQEIVQALMDLHGSAIEKILDKIAAGGEGGLTLINSLALDPIIESVLLLYGLHPLELEARVALALEKVRPYLHSHGGNVELLGIVDGVVRLRLEGSCHGCPSSAQTLKQTIEEAIYERAPDATAIEVEGEIAQVSPPDLKHRGVALPILAG
jgi:Fe-S cluster biogenesis protein NfuA